MQYFHGNLQRTLYGTVSTATLAFLTLFSQISYAQNQAQTCLDQEGEKITCPDKGAVISQKEPVFLKKGNKIITDLSTGLSWERNTVDKNGDKVISEKDTLTWKKANSYCETLNTTDKDNWRLPTIAELNTLVDFERKFPASKAVFTSQSAYYWSSTPYIDNKAKAWALSFYYGNNAWLYKSSSLYLRCVRNDTSL